MSTNKELLEAVREIKLLVVDLPGGVDYEADLEDTSPEDMTAHIGGLIWQICDRFIDDGEEQ